MDVDELRSLLLQGATVHMGFASGGRIWWIESPYEEIDDETMQAASVGHNGDSMMVEAGDSLFGWPGNSQTWRSIYGA